MEIKIKRIGMHCGTVGWLAKQMETATIESGHNKEKKPGLWIKTQDGKSECIALFSNDYTYGQTEIVGWEELNGPYNKCFGNIFLTDAANNAMCTISELAQAALQKILDTDDAIAMPTIEIHVAKEKVKV